MFLADQLADLDPIIENLNEEDDNTVPADLTAAGSAAGPGISD